MAHTEDPRHFGWLIRRFIGKLRRIEKRLDLLEECCEEKVDPDKGGGGHKHTVTISCIEEVTPFGKEHICFVDYPKEVHRGDEVEFCASNIDAKVTIAEAYATPKGSHNIKKGDCLTVVVKDTAPLSPPKWNPPIICKNCNGDDGPPDPPGMEVKP